MHSFTPLHNVNIPFEPAHSSLCPPRQTNKVVRLGSASSEADEAVGVKGMDKSQASWHGLVALTNILSYPFRLQSWRRLSSLYLILLASTVATKEFELPSSAAFGLGTLPLLYATIT